MTKLFKTLCIALIAFFAIGVANAQNVRTYVHPNAYKLAPIFKEELREYFPDIPQPWYVLGLAEHESCISLKHSRCLSTTSTFSTKWKETGTQRELGAGIGMITKAWTRDGKVRMDTLANLKKAYPNELKDLTWDNISQSPNLQARSMILLLRQDYRGLSMVPDKVERLKFADSAYNGGRRDAITARNRCSMTKGCDPDIWFDHVERHSPKSTKKLYGDRSAKDINLHHVRDVFEVRMPKYQKVLPSISE